MSEKNETALAETSTAPLVTAPQGTGIGHALAVLKQAEEFAGMLANSQFVPNAFRGKKGDVMCAIVMGEFVGLNPMQALQSIAVINGRPCIWGDGALAICRSHPEFEDISEALDRAPGSVPAPDGNEDSSVRATCTVTRRGQTPVTRTFSVADAKKAGLWGKKGPWCAYPKRMLQMRARGFALRDAFADALTGVHLREEVEDMPADVIDVTPRAEVEPFADQPQGRRMSLSPSVLPSPSVPSNGDAGAQTTVESAPAPAAAAGNKDPRPSWPVPAHPETGTKGQRSSKPDHHFVAKVDGSYVYYDRASDEQIAEVRLLARQAPGAPDDADAALLSAIDAMRGNDPGFPTTTHEWAAAHAEKISALLRAAIAQAKAKGDAAPEPDDQPEMEF